MAGVDDDVADTGAGDHHGNNSIDTSNAGTYSGDLVDSSSDAALNVDVEAQRKLMREIQRKNERRQQAKDATLLRQMQDLEYEQALRADMGLDVNENIGGGGDMKDSYNEYTHAQNNDNVGVDIIDNDEDDALLDDALDYDDDDIDIDIDELGSEDLSSGDEYSRNSTHGQGHRKKRMPLSQRNRAGTHRDTVLAYVQNLRTFTQQQSGANTGVTDTQQTHPLSSPLLRVRIRLPGEIAPYSAASSSIQSSPSRGMLQLNISGSTSVSWLLATCEAAVLDALVSQYDAGNNSGNNHNHNHNINQNAMIPSVDLPLAPADSGSAAFTSEWFSRSFRLCVTYPRMILDDPDITLAELGIKHSTTLVLEEK